jgi:cytochrome c oxidase cbb3-type subunit 3
MRMRPSAPVQFPSSFSLPGALAAVNPRRAGLVGAGLVACLMGTSACDRPPSADSLQQWTQADHHSTDDDKAAARQGAMLGQVPRSSAAAAAAAAKGGGGGGGGGDVAQLVDIAWRQQCTSCHGAVGRGDGQMGPMVQAPDLTRADWQSQTTDAEMAAIIKSGRNRMPRFDLPDPVIAGLVTRIRSLERTP